MTEAMTPEQMQAEIARLTALVAAKPSGAIKISPKGAISVYGLGRFPVTLYASQWEALFLRQDAVKQFILDNMALLATKEAKV